MIAGWKWVARTAATHSFDTHARALTGGSVFMGYFTVLVATLFWPGVAFSY